MHYMQCRGSAEAEVPGACLWQFIRDQYFLWVTERGCFPGKVLGTTRPKINYWCCDAWQDRARRVRDQAFPTLVLLRAAPISAATDIYRDIYIRRAVPVRERGRMLLRILPHPNFFYIGNPASLR